MDTQHESFAGMNSRIVVEDIDTGEEFSFTLVPPDQLEGKKSRISVTTPLGTAVTGKKVGSVIEWEAPSRLRRLKIQQVFI